jgi:hypothetical protein
MNARRCLLAGVVASVAITHGIVAAPAQPGMTYESLRKLPAFAGMWTPMLPPFVQAAADTAGSRPAAANLVCVGPPGIVRPEASARCKALLAQAGPTQGSAYCAQRPFTGLMPRGAGGSLEVLFTPGQVTIAVESGLVRRIYLRATPPAAALDESASGTSIGRWEGKALIVTTTGLDQAANIAFLPGVPIGAGAHVHERISLLDADTLQIETTLEAPMVLAAPLSGKQQYQRASDRFFTPFETCVEGDRSVDPATGKERFDMTPPADLAPTPNS